MFLGVHFGGKWRIEKGWLWFESIAFVKEAEMGKVNVCVRAYIKKKFMKKNKGPKAQERKEGIDLSQMGLMKMRYPTRPQVSLKSMILRTMLDITICNVQFSWAKLPINLNGL